MLAVAGTTISTVIVAAALWYALPGFGLALPLGYCLLFGALISPTDPIAEVLITLAAILGGYSLAAHLHVSAPLAMVVTGLIIGNQGRALSVPAGAERDVLVALTYAVVVFSILMQGGSIGALIRRYVVQVR